jgi:hypothetical protein
MTTRLLRPFNIDVAHKPTRKLRSYFTKHKDRTITVEKRNAIYIIPCRDCPQRYIGQTSKKIETRITEHKNAIKRYDLMSLPAVHTCDNCHTFNWTHTELLGQAQTKHAREFKEAWHSMDNREVKIPRFRFRCTGDIHVPVPVNRGTTCNLRNRRYSGVS